MTFVVTMTVNITDKDLEKLDWQPETVKASLANEISAWLDDLLENPICINTIEEVRE